MATCPKCGKTYQDSVIVCPDDNTPLDSMLGKLLAGRYRLIEKIGEGGMGAIYKAVHTMMDRTCAIKLLTSVSARDEQAVARFNREARMASKIDNAHAVTIYDFGESEEGLLYLAMEYIEGEPLSRLLQREKVLRVDQVVSIVSQIAEALTAAHALGIIHRDLKPDNVMITRRGAETCYVKVLDFGIAKAVAEDSSDNHQDRFCAWNAGLHVARAALGRTA
jgi:serine/threonine-protein kinase